MKLPEFKIKRLGLHGDGIATAYTGDIFVPFSLPGEVVTGEVVSHRIEMPKIETPSESRVKPPCSHFKSCGGCALQHASDDFLAEWKVDVVKAALSAQGLTAEFRAIETSPPNSRRRATLSGRRTKKGAIVGFHGRASGTLIPIPNCTLLHPDIMAALPALEALTKAGASRKGEISITVTQAQGGLDVAVTDAKAPDGPKLAELGQLAGQLGFARLSWDGDVIAERSAPTQSFGDARVTPPPGAFLQATQAGQDALTAAVLEAVGDAAHVADLFAGCGTFSLPLAKTASVYAAEGEALLMEALNAGWRHSDGLKNLTVETRDLFRRPLQPAEFGKFDAVVLDPPRAGAQAQCEVLANTNVKRIAFVSCNPVTFARDAKILTAGGYRLHWVQTVDQFRWSNHVELVALLTKP